MRLRTLAAATAVALVASVAPTVAADAAAKKPAYKVSVSISKSAADVGTSIKLTGTVKGAKAAKKRLLVQRKVGSGKWTTVRKVTTTKTRRYSASVKISTAGAHQFRVVAPKSKKVRQGVSSVRRLTGWRWLDATKQRFQDVNAVGSTGPVKIAGKTYPTAWRLPTSTARYLNPAGSCDAFTASVGVIDGNESGGSFAAAHWADWQLSNGFKEYGWPLALGAAPQPVRIDLRRVAAFAVGNFDSASVGVVSPRLHCSVNSLPQPTVPQFG